MSKNPLLVHLNFASGFGGGEVQTINLMKNLLGIQQYCVAKNKSLFKKEVLSQCGNVKVISLYQLFLLAFLHRRKLIIHSHDGRSVHIAGLFKKFFGVKIVITRRMTKLVKKRFSKLAYLEADYVIAVSNAVRSTLDFLHTPALVIPDSFSNLPQNDEVDNTLKLYKNKFIVSHVANLLPIKNHELTVSLAKKYEKEEVVFLIVGDGPERKKLEKLASGLNNVIFLGFTPFVGSVLKHTNLLILPSHNEGLGSIILEAYQHNVPVIASNVGGVSDIVEDGKTGFLVESNTVEEFSCYIDYFINNPDFTVKCKDNIVSFANAYSPEAIAKKYKSLYLTHIV